MFERFRHTLLRNLFGFERPETTGEIIFYRFFEAFLVFWVIKYAWRWGRYLEKISDVVLPLGIAQYIDVSFMFEHSLGLVNAGLISLCMLLGFFRWGRYSYLIALLLLHLQYVSRFSLGEISHGSNFVGMALLSMGLATVLFRERLKVRRFTLGCSYFFFGLGYTTAAFSKLVATGPWWVDGRHLWMWIWERTVDTYSTTGAIGLNGLQQLALDSHAVATLILTFGFVAEFFGWLIWFRTPRPYIMTLLIAMHFGILAVMKISFSSNTYLLILLAYPWATLIEAGLQRLDAPLRSRMRRLLASSP